MTVAGAPERMSPVTVLLGAGVAAAAVVVAVLHRAVVADGAGRLLTADLGWLALAVAGAALVWPAGTLMQLGALTFWPPLLRLFAVQVAGSFANHLLPAGVGGIAVNVRFLRRLGLTRPEALSAQALNAGAGAVTHLALLAATLALAPPALRAPATARLDSASDGPGRLLLVGLALAVLAGTVFVLARGRAAAEYRRLAAVAACPGRAALLWAGALAGPLAHSIALYAVLHAVGAPLPFSVVAPVYLASSAVSALIPSPGGIGSLDVVLTAGLVAAGLPVAAAVGGLVAYRFLTVWIPVVPGACTLGVLVKRRIV